MEVDTFDGDAWLSVVPFRMSGVGPRGLPDLPGVRAFPELNVRTYVRAGGEPGVWFYSLDAASPAAVAAGRRLFHMPYLNARMSMVRTNGTTSYRSVRTHRGAAAGRFAAHYRPTGASVPAPVGSLEHWLTHRLCFYSATTSGRLYRGRVAHPAWPLQTAECTITENTLVAQHGFRLDGDPHVLHSRALDVQGWWLERVS